MAPGYFWLKACINLHNIWQICFKVKLHAQHKFLKPVKSIFVQVNCNTFMCFHQTWCLVIKSKVYMPFERRQSISYKLHVLPAKTFAFVYFLFIFMSGKGCGLWLCQSLDFSLIFFFNVGLKTLWILGYPQRALRRLWSDCADAQADLSSLGANVVLYVVARLMILYTLRGQKRFRIGLYLTRACALHRAIQQKPLGILYHSIRRAVWSDPSNYPPNHQEWADLFYQTTSQQRSSLPP